MPFKSEAQEKAMWANAPDVARKWADQYGSLLKKKADRKKKSFKKRDK